MMRQRTNSSRWLRWCGVGSVGLLLWGVMVWASCSPAPTTETSPPDASQETQREPLSESATEPASEPSPEKASPTEGRAEVREEPAGEPVVEVSPSDGGAVERTPESTPEKVAESVAESRPERPPEGDCWDGETRACYPGATSTRGKGNCKDGRQLCVKGAWGPCLNATLPQTEICDGKDNDCDGAVDETCCSSFRHRVSWFASRAAIADLAFSPNGQDLAVAYSDAYVRVWRLSDNRLRARYQFAYQKPARSVDWGPDNVSLVSSSEGDTFRLRELGSSSYKHTFQGHVSYVTKVRFSPNGKYIASGGADATVRLWDVASGKELRVWKGHSQPITGVSFSPDSKRVVSSSDDATLRVWSVTSNKPVLSMKGHTDLVTDVSYSPDGKRIASSSFDKDIRLWSASTGKLLRTIAGHKSFVLGLSFHPNSQELVSIAFQERPHLWRVKDGALVRQLSFYGSGLDVTVTRFHPHGRMVASGGKDGQVRLWNVGRDRLVTEGFGPEIVAMAVHPKKPWIALARDNSHIDIWNTQTQTFVQTLQGHTSYVRTLFFTSDGKSLVSGAYDGRLMRWDTQTWSSAYRVDVSSPRRVVRWIAPLPNAKQFASISDDRRIKIWDVASGKLVTTLGNANNARKTNIYALDVHRNGDWIATGASSADPTIRIWSRKQNKILRVLQGHRSSVYALSFAPTGNLLASAGSSDRTVKLWDASTGKLVRTLITGGPGENMWAVAFSPDGKWLAAYAEYGTVYVWKTPSFQLVARLRLASAYALALTWSPNSRTLYAANRQGQITAWIVAASSCSP